MTTKTAKPGKKLEAPEEFLTDLELSKCHPDNGVQSRADLSDAAVEIYTQDVLDGAVFPPVVVFRDLEEQQDILAAGFHRWYAHNGAGKTHIRARVIIGTRRDAILFSVGSNGHAQWQRTPADKRYAVRMLLSDEEWWLRSDNWIADKCKVSHQFVGIVREEMQDERDAAAQAEAEKEAARKNASLVTVTSEDQGPEPEEDSAPDQPSPGQEPAPMERQTRHKSGQVVTMNTGNIGKGNNRQRPPVILIERDPKKRELISKQEIRSLPKWVKQCKRLGLTLNQAKEKLEKVWHEIVAEAG